MKYGYVINVTALDRPGIVAGVSSAIDKVKGNIESCSQTVLDGYFTLIMTFSTPEYCEPEALRAKVLEEKGMENCQAILFESAKDVKQSLPSDVNSYVISAFGKDSEGIVAQFSRYLCEKQINIIDLYGNITQDGEFVLIGQVEVDPKLDLKVIQYDLEALGEEVGFTVRIQHNKVFVATNQIRLNR
ncbi:MAG: ACT domain-containing protein [Planctomycetia bacterium]|nr:ACT domain-containing protein [Planctomycetia bacterium]